MQIKICRWKNNAKKAVALCFDDSLNSHLQYAIPELISKKITGTFYLNPGSSWFDKEKWQKKYPGKYIVFANHTHNHKSVQTPAEAENQISRCNEFILNSYPKNKKQDIISFAIPGGVKWHIPKEHLTRILKKHKLLLRPRPQNNVAGLDLKTADDLIQFIQRFRNSNKPIIFIFHGIESDWLPFPFAEFKQFVSFLSENRGNLWISDPVSIHKYRKEFLNSDIKIIEKTKNTCQFFLKHKLGNAYNYPLTISIKISEKGKKLRISQSNKNIKLKMLKQHAIFDLIPNSSPVSIEII